MEEDMDERMSVRSGSPAPSMYSFHPSVDEQRLLREVYGRTLNNSNETYMLPADLVEHQRLDLQHEIYKLALGGSLYPVRDLVAQALQPREGQTPAIIDVGTGSGSWALDMAKEFPHAEVVGVDLVPPLTQRRAPPNCRFEIDDANLGFPHYYNSFDVVHARAISSGVRDWPGLLQEFAEMLRPGGVLVLADGDLQLYDRRQQPLPVAAPGAKDFTWTQQLFTGVYSAMKKRGAWIDSMTKNPEFLESVDGLCERGKRNVFIPIGPWPKYLDPAQRMISELMLKNTVSHVNGLGPYLLSSGDPRWTEEEVRTHQQNSEAELSDGRVKIYALWHFVWAVKR